MNMKIRWGGRIQKKGFIVMLSALAAALLVSSVVLQQRVSALTLQVNASYQKSFYETIELMNGIQLNLEKLTVTGSGSQEQALLTAISRQAEGVTSNLSQMPLSDTTLQGALKFVNQTADIARVLAERIGAGGTLTAEDQKLLSDLHNTSVKLNRQLMDLLTRYDAGEPVFAEGNVMLSAAATQAPEEESSPAVDYPELLYDGPFSDARNDQEIQLAGQPVTQEQAASMLTDFIGKERVKGVTYTGDSEIFSSCYEFAAALQDGNTLTAGVTKTGGHVVYMLPEMDNTEIKLTEGDCIDQGSRFLAAHGYENMEVNYWRKLDGILTVNYAATQGGVLLYPDLVKLQVSMSDGLVVGIEAVNYLTNHKTRAIPEPAITEEDARSRVNPALTVERVRRCIIPLDEGEVQCWEITAALSDDERYLVYIDAATGVEETILRIMQDDNGIVTQ